MIDVPGIEDKQASDEILSYIEDYAFRILPILLINMTQGTVKDLVQFQPIFDTFGKSKLEIPVIFTNFA